MRSVAFGYLPAPVEQISAARCEYPPCMGSKVSTLLNVDPRGGRYVFLLIGWNDYSDPIRAEMGRQADAFGMDLGPSGVLVQPYPQKMYEIAAEVLAKPWPKAIADRFKSDPDPIMLVFDRDWLSFDPRQDPFGVIWLSQFSPPAEVRKFLQSLAALSHREDVIAYLHDLAERERHAAGLGKRWKGIRRLARAASYIEIKPGVFGVTVDDAILSDIAGKGNA